MSKRNQNILETANDLTSGARRERYGHPSGDFECAAAMITAYLKRRHQAHLADEYIEPGEIIVEAGDIPHIMDLVKTARDAWWPSIDNWVDKAGYMRTREMLEEPSDEE